MRFLVLLASVAILLPTYATEPDGHLQLHVERVHASADGGPPIVRLSIRSYVPLDEITLTVSTPVDFALLPLTLPDDTSFYEVRATRDRRAIRAGLPRLDPSMLSTLDFELVSLPDGNGTLEFIVEGRDESGRRIRNAVGLAVRESGPAGVRRLGAVEFPAVVLPSTEKR